MVGRERWRGGEERKLRSCRAGSTQMSKHALGPEQERSKTRNGTFNSYGVVTARFQVWKEVAQQ